MSSVSGIIFTALPTTHTHESREATGMVAIARNGDFEVWIVTSKDQVAEIVRGLPIQEVVLATGRARASSLALASDDRAMQLPAFPALIVLNLYKSCRTQGGAGQLGFAKPGLAYFATEARVEERSDASFLGLHLDSAERPRLTWGYSRQQAVQYLQECGAGEDHAGGLDLSNLPPESDRPRVDVLGEAALYVAQLILRCAARENRR